MCCETWAEDSRCYFFAVVGKMPNSLEGDWKIRFLNMEMDI